jgi:hypothetical protein
MSKELRQLFKNNSDCYVNTIDESIEQAMSEDRFVKVFQERMKEENPKIFRKGYEKGWLGCVQEYVLTGQVTFKKQDGKETT